ncbi:MAG TPA: DUF6578 domain-containing protein [Mycobacteriales bacterium]|jgi:hypothetical protein|nr:DUF6578 domain-containing protein [Mycobacteriales bacterium]
MRVMVFVERWQYECCGVEFTVGGEVEWLLAVDRGWREMQLGAGAPTQVIDLPVARVLLADGPEQGGLLLSHDGLHAFLSQDAVRPNTEGSAVGSTRSVVLFEEDHHGGVPASLPPTRGVVETAQLVRCAFVRDPTDGVHKPVSGSTTFASIDRAARWQIDEVAGQRFIGFLVGLRVRA